MRAVAYIRKSKINPNGHGLSWEVQEAQVRDLATRNGDAEIVIVSDWGSSGAAAASAFGGTGRGGRRRAWQSLLAAIDEGAIGALYAYSLSRLARSTKELLDLGERCAKAGVVVRLAKEGTLDFTSAHGRLYLTVLAAVATFEAEVSAEKARDHISLRRSRGDHIGKPPYGFHLVDGKLRVDQAHPIQPVLDAYAEAGSYNGGARLLNQRRVPGVDAERWSDMTVRRIVARAEGADHRPRPSGRPGRNPALLSGLLRCPCGTTMTPTRDARRLASGAAVYTSYICWRGRHDPDHPRPYKVSEGAFLPWVREEAARLEPPQSVESAGDPARQGDLLARRQRVINNYEDGLIGRDERAEKVAAIDAELERLAAVSAAVLTLPKAVDWSWDTQAINGVLRAMWDHVELDGAMRPVCAEWLVPEWRQP